METTRARALIVVAVAATAVGVLSAWPRGGRLPTAPVVVAPDRAWLVGQKLDLNAASASSLARISGIGPSLAAKIVAERGRRGRFSNIGELDDVDGIGPKTQETLAAFVEVR